MFSVIFKLSDKKKDTENRCPFPNAILVFVCWEYLLHYAQIQPPPSALIVWPESQWLSSEARNTTIGATSS